jgi:hypothetical protein
MESPDIHVLEPCNWQLFGSFSFKSERIPERVRLAMWFSLAREVCKWHGVYFPRLLWALRQEPGEIGGRLHFHALIGGLPPHAVSVPTCFAVMAAWERLGGGMARCREFDRTRNGPGYITECLTTHGDCGADAYESAKFGDSRCHLLVAESVNAVNLAAVRRAGLPGRIGRRSGDEGVTHSAR